MARNVDDDSRTAGRRTSRRVTAVGSQRPAATRHDRRRFWIRLLAGLLVLAMLLPVVAVFISVL